ncbi:MAG: MFS family permease [Candidatus Woesearchaeota archaeon]|jgi:MFS family permease
MHHDHAHIHHQLIHYFTNKELDERYISVFFRTLAQSLISVFIPIYLYNLGFSLAKISIFFIIYFGLIPVYFPLCMQLTRLWGVKKTMAAGTVMLLVYYFFLHLISQGLPMYYAAVTFGISVGLYYSAYHMDFAHTVKKEKGRTLGLFTAIAILANVAGPFIGSILINKYSFVLVFIISAILCVISFMSLFFTPDYKLKNSHIQIIKAINSDTPQKAVVYMTAGCLGTIGGIFWPIFIFLTLDSVVSLGAIVSITSLFVAGAVILLGNASDKHGKWLYLAGTAAHAPTWIARLFLLSPFGLLFSNVWSSLSFYAIDLSFARQMYSSAQKKQKNIANYFYFREIFLESGRLIILAFVVATMRLDLLFYVAAFVTLAYFILYTTHVHKNP